MATDSVVNRLVALCVWGAVCYLPAIYALTATQQNALTTGSSIGGSKVTLSVSGSYYTISSTGVPGHSTDSFPTSYNPNSIGSHSYSWTIPASPVYSSTNKGCLPMGAIGVAITGVPFYNPLTDGMKNAVEGEDKEKFDSCSGHPDATDSYHYHQEVGPACIPEMEQEDALVGIAFDGFPIYSAKTSGGVTLTTADLDDCHGRLVGGAYRYHITADCPYILGCYRSSLHSSLSAQQNSDKCQVIEIDSVYCSATAASVSLLPLVATIMLALRHL